MERRSHPVTSYSAFAVCRSHPVASYSAFAVSNNYLYDDDDEDAPPGMPRNDPSLWEGDDPTLKEENAELNRQIKEWESELVGDGVDGSVVGGSSPFFNPEHSDEPWDWSAGPRRPRPTQTPTRMCQPSTRSWSWSGR